jgi:hypothetical protein
MTWFCVSIKLDDDCPVGLPLASFDTAAAAKERLLQIKALCTAPIEFIIEMEDDMPDMTELLNYRKEYYGMGF